MTSELVQQMLDKNILLTHGKGKGNAFLINPKLLADSKLNLPPSLKTVEPYVLEQLVLTDIKNYPHSSIGDIDNRIKDISKKELQKVIYKLVDKGDVVTTGPKKYRKYLLAEKKRNEKEK